MIEAKLNPKKFQRIATKNIESKIESSNNYFLNQEQNKQLTE
jgi:hypothetical protein